MTEAVGEIGSAATSTGATTQERRAILRLATTHAIRLAVDVVDTVYNAGGVTTIYEGFFTSLWGNSLAQQQCVRFAHCSFLPAFD